MPTKIIDANQDDYHRLVGKIMPFSALIFKQLFPVFF
jgi:hypothetical protein